MGTDTPHLVAGLGNPGADYAQTRHNAGFLAVERIGAKHRAEWKQESRFHARVARIAIGPLKVVLCEPQTFMNGSGEAIAPLAAFYKIPPERVLVLVDDADLPLGQLRLRADGSSGGHHGLESIERHLGGRAYPRLRIGIGRGERQVREITGHVLGRFAADERELLEKVLERCVAQVECCLQSGVQKAMSQYNGAVAAPAKKEAK
jgi:PTH1 family peptidyl-tRNA hydrolase